MVHATVRMVIPAGERGEVLNILRSISERTRLEQGCIGAHVYQAEEDGLAIMVEEFWAGEEDLERHLRSEDYQRILLLVEMALEPPEIRFNVISRSTGVETIEEARRIPQEEKDPDLRSQAHDSRNWSEEKDINIPE